MGVRVSKSFKVAPRLMMRLNAKSTSMTFGAISMRCTVNSAGQRTAAARISGTGLSVRHASGTRGRTLSARRSAPLPGAAEPARVSAEPAPGRACSLQGAGSVLTGPGPDRRVLPVQRAASASRRGSRWRDCRAHARRAVRLRPGRVMAVGEFFVSRVEVAGGKFLRRHAPVRSFAMPAGGRRQVAVPLSRDLIGMLAGLKGTPAADELRRVLADIRRDLICAGRSQGTWIATGTGSMTCGSCAAPAD